MLKRYIMRALLPLVAYNYYELAVQKWCSDDYMIHGLWPQIDETHYPVYCDDVTYVEPTGDLLANMSTYWRGCDDTLWSHEWEKHGSCIENVTETEFFETTLDLFLSNRALVEACDDAADDCIIGCFDLDLSPIDCP